MIKNIRLIFTCLLLTVTLGFVLGCSGNSSCPAPNSKEIFISTKGKGDVPIEDIFSEHRYIPLETRDDALLPGLTDIIRLLLNNERIYISDGKSVMRFNFDGRLDCKYSHEGEGAHEYMGLASFSVIDDGDVVFYGMLNRSIFNYTPDDHFVSRWQYKQWFIREIINLDDDLLLLQCMDNIKDSYRFHVVNRYTGEEVNAYWKLDNPDPCLMFMRDFYCRYDGKIIKSFYKSNNVYELSRDSAILRYTINIDNKIPPVDYWMRGGNDPVAHFERYRLQDDYIGHIPVFLESDRSILLRYDGGAKERQGYAFVDKATRESRAIVRFIFEDGFVHQPEYFFPLSDGWCAMLLYPEDIFKNTVFAQRFPGLDEESNPVLFLGKLR